VTFGPFVLSVAQRRLCCASERVPLTPKEIELLVVLAEHESHIVSKDELIARLWGGEAASDAALTQTIYRLRRTLAEYADGDDDFVRTIHGVGFQLVCEDRSETTLQRDTL
jgi:DNA-binding winged helix-turn-helix (wHTH) protein